MENNNNIIALLEAFQYREIASNEHYIVYTNNANNFVYVFLLAIDDENNKYILVDGFSYKFYESQHELISYLNYSLKNNKDFIDYIVNKNTATTINEGLKKLIALTKINFFKTLTLTTNTSDVINSYFIYHSDLDNSLKFLVTLDESLYRNGSSFVLFNENNYRSLLPEPNFFKSISGEPEEQLFITSNPYMFAIYNQTGDKKSMLFCSEITMETLVETLSKKHPDFFDKIELGILNNLNDLIFGVKAALGYYNVFFKDVFQLKIIHNKIIITFKFNVKELDKYDNELLTFAGLLGILNTELQEQDLDNKENLFFSSDSYKINNLSFKQLIIPYQIEFIETFLICFISSFKLTNFFLKRDLSFEIEEEEESFGMFDISN